jgi:D-alanyl-D-alanine dipeptidase
MFKIFSLVLIFIGGLNGYAQQVQKPNHGLKVVNDYKTYRKSIAKNPDLELVEIKKAIPSVVLDIKYATTDNFMKEVMYKKPRAFARKPVVEKLKLIQAALNKDGYGLKIYDGYRPYDVTVLFYEKASDKNFVANPAKGSKHNRGCAIDLSIIDLKTGKDVPMPTPYDSFEAAAAATYTNLLPQIIKNRNYLIKIMEANGFKVLAHEWWHFDFVGWQNYELMNIPFEKL